MQSLQAVLDVQQALQLAAQDSSYLGRAPWNLPVRSKLACVYAIGWSDMELSTAINSLFSVAECDAGERRIFRRLVQDGRVFESAQIEGS